MIRNLAFAAISMALIAPAWADDDTVKIGAPMVLSGASAVVGQGGLQGLQMAVDDINKAGGLLGKHIELVVADDAGNPATANTVTRNMILNNKIVAMFPGSNSASGAAEEVLAGQSKIPAIFFSATDISLTTSNFNDYTFQMSPSTYMDPRAWAAYIKSLGAKRVYVINPDINFGHSYSANLKAGLAENGSGAEIVGEQYPALGTSDFSPFVSAAAASDPDFIFLGLLPGDLITFLRQARGYGLLETSQLGAPNAVDVITTMRGKTPKGLNLRSITPLYFPGAEPEIDRFSQRYHAEKGAWPTEWPVLSYAALQTWAEAVKKAGSFDGDAVAKALSENSLTSIRGNIQFRPCDHQAMIPVYIGKAADTVDPEHGFPLMVDYKKIPPDDMVMSCEQAKKLQAK